MNIAVGFVHGIGRQQEGFHLEMAAKLEERLAKACPEVKVYAEGIYWADITDRLENKLKAKLAPYGLRWDHWADIRGYVISFLADAIAYQPVPHEDDSAANEYIYADIHERFCEKLQVLSDRAGPDAPLCLISHSLGSIIASNYVYDLQNGKLPARIRDRIKRSDSPLVQGHTLTHFYTMGSPIALWTMRYKDFGRPIDFPPQILREHGLPYGEWVNFYDKDDIVAYPLKSLSKLYDESVSEDLEVSNPGWLANTPLGSHGGYYDSEAVMNRIVASWVELYNRTAARDETAAGSDIEEGENRYNCFGN